MSVNTARLKRMNALAQKYLALYENKDTTEDDVCRDFADECFDLEIEMDCEKGFVVAYGPEPTRDAASFQARSNEITDADLLASEIFSKWRYITHWSYGEKCVGSDNREWFIAALRRLVEITGQTPQ